MALTLDVAQVGAYVEISEESISVAQVGAYVEVLYLRERVAQVGAYVEVLPPIGGADASGPRLQVI